jgi:N,N-dimethylformamidase beta subunit-like, C-terminal
VAGTATLALLAVLGCVGATGITRSGPAGVDGRDQRLRPTNRPTIEAAFLEESYAPGETARLVIWTSGSRVSLQVFRAGTESGMVRAQDVMLGSAVTPVRLLGSLEHGRAIRVRIGDWPSGLYFAELWGSHGKVGYAPFVLRPRHLGEEAHVAVVFSTMTWQAYNFHDDDGNGSLDTWYAGAPHARLARPFENRGVIPHYKHYEQPFVRWLVSENRAVDYLADADLDSASVTGARLARQYRLIVFPGHHEYVTPHEFAVIAAYRNRGGHLMFLSANNFYWRTVKHGNLMTRTARWRKLHRPEASLIGVQYFGNDRGQHQGPWVVADSPAAEWIFTGTGLEPGMSFGRGGVEADGMTSSSPPGTEVVARIPNIFGHGRDAEMTYYELPNGAKVFAAGAFTLAGEVWKPEVGRLVDNLWSRLGGDAEFAVERRS